MLKGCLLKGKLPQKCLLVQEYLLTITNVHVLQAPVSFQCVLNGKPAGKVLLSFSRKKADVFFDIPVGMPTDCCC
jgi:hypothetical protein